MPKSSIAQNVGHDISIGRVPCRAEQRLLMRFFTHPGEWEDIWGHLYVG